MTLLAFLLFTYVYLTITQSDVGYFIGTDITGSLTAGQVCNSAGARLAIIDSQTKFTEASSVASSSGYGWVVVALYCPAHSTACSESAAQWRWYDSAGDNEALCDISVGGMDDLSLYQSWDQWNKVPEANEHCVEFYSGKLVLEFCNSGSDGVLINSDSPGNAALCQPLSSSIASCSDASDMTNTSSIDGDTVILVVVISLCVCLISVGTVVFIFHACKRGADRREGKPTATSTKTSSTSTDSRILLIVGLLPIIAYVMQFPSYLSSIVGLIGDGGNVHDSCTSVCTANEGYYNFAICEYTEGDAYTFGGCGDVGGYSGAMDDAIGCYPFEDSSDWLSGWSTADCMDYDYEQDKCESITCASQCDTACSWRIALFLSIVFYSIVTEFPTWGDQTEEDHALHNRFVTKFLGLVMAYGNRCMMYGISTSPWGMKFVFFSQMGSYVVVAWMAYIDFQDLRSDFKLARLQNLFIYFFGMSFIINIFVSIGSGMGMVPLSDVWAVFAFDDWSSDLMFSISIFGVTVLNVLELIKQVSMRALLCN